MITRVRGWRTELLLWADGRAGLQFAWGETDCASLARQALGILFGRDVVPHIQAWHTAWEAAACWREHGPIDRVLLDLGAALAAIPFLRAGDVVVAREPEECVGRRGAGVAIDGRWCLTSNGEAVVVVEAASFERAYSLWMVRDCV